MIGLQVINLLPKDDGPKVLAHKLDNVKRIIHARPIAREALHEAVPHPVPQHVQPVEDRLAHLVLFVVDSAAAAQSVVGRCRRLG